LHVKCSGCGRGSGGKKNRENSSNMRKREAGGIPSVARKTIEWLVVATTAEMRRWS